MFKRFIIGTLAAVIVVAAGASIFTALAAPSGETQSQPVAASLSTQSAAVSSVDVTAADTSVQVVAATTLTSEESAGLLYMYEEEKLARDVYNALYSLWGQTTFQNIASSEQSHMDAIKTLLDRYGLAVPENTAGVFSNPSLQALYNDLMATGSLSLAEALKAGATIEEVDIVDLQSHLARTTNVEIQQVYNNLMNGSYNHLRNFVNVLNRLTGEIYQPQYLSADLYQSILAGSNGNRQGQGGANGALTTDRGNGYDTGFATDTINNQGGRGRGHRGGR